MNHSRQGKTENSNYRIKSDLSFLTASWIILAVIMILNGFFIYRNFHAAYDSFIRSSAFSTVESIENLHSQFDENSTNTAFLLGEMQEILNNHAIELNEDDYKDLLFSTNSIMKHLSLLIGEDWLEQKDFFLDALPYAISQDGKVVIHPSGQQGNYANKLFFQQLLAKNENRGTLQHRVPETSHGELYTMYYKYNDDLEIYSVIDIEQKELNRPVRTFLIKLILISVIFYLLIASLIFAVNYILFRRIYALRLGIHAILAGKPFELSKSRNRSETGKTNNLIIQLNDFVHAIADELKNISSDEASEHETEKPEQKYHNILSESLNEAKSQLKKYREQEKARNEENEKQNWIAKGIAKFSDIIRKNNELAIMGEQIMSNLASYLNVNQCGLFAVDSLEAEKNNHTLTLIAVHAYDRSKHLNKEVKFGDGLVGECAKEGKPKKIDKIPQGYLHITSGLGQATPDFLFLMPLINEEKVLGVIEIASFKPLTENETEFLQQLSEIIASAISNVLINENTTKLLQETRQQAERMASQEEEMRQTMEELQATQEEMNRKNKQVEELNQQFKEKEKEYLTMLEAKDDEIKQLKSALNK